VAHASGGEPVECDDEDAQLRANALLETLELERLLNRIAPTLRKFAKGSTSEIRTMADLEEAVR
jgi:hypothetical protein